MDRILIIRLSAIGDLVMASPLIGAFRRTWPEAHIAWLAEEGSSPVLEANADLDELILWPRRRWRGLLRRGRLLALAREVIPFVRALRNRKFDIAVDAQGLLKSGIWTYLSGAPDRIGIGSREGSRFLMTRVVDRSGASDRVSSQYFLLAQEMGLDTGDFSMRIDLPPEAHEFAEGVAAGIVCPYAVFAPFTTRPQKHWLEDRWPQVADLLFSELGLKTVVLGGPNDMEPADRIAGMSQGTVNLAGKTSLQQAGAVIARSSLLVGVDTGLTHMGIALGVPTIALFGATRPYLDTTGTSGTVLYHPFECSPCRRSPTCDGEFPCMDAISAEEVLLTARRLLGAG